MKKEDLFLAIGSVEESRLARSEMCVSSTAETEDMKMNVRPTRMIRNLLIAAVIVSTLAVTAFAVTGFLIFESPEEMITAIFGDRTGFDHSEGGEVIFEHGDMAAVEPTFDRVPADEAAVGDMVSHVDFVGQSVSSGDYVLTVDAFVYDDTTKCGFVTYLLDNPNGASGYKLQPNGEIWYDGAPDPVQVNQYGYPHIIQEKTTPTCLAATYYFRDTGLFGENLVLSLPSEEEPMTDEQINQIIVMLDAKIREEMTPEQAIEKAKETLGEAIFAVASELPVGANMTQQEWEAECAYIILRDQWYHEEYEQKGPSITIPMAGESLTHITAENGAVVISPISFQLDATNLDDSFAAVSSDNTASVVDLVICFADGTEYVVLGENMENVIFKLVDSATEGREDTYNRYTCMFNRIIDVEKIDGVIINGNEVSLD